MKLTTVSCLLMFAGVAVFVLNLVITSRMASTDMARVQGIAAQLEIAYSHLQRDIDDLNDLLRHEATDTGDKTPDSPIPAVVDCVGAWTPWSRCSDECQGSRLRMFHISRINHGPGGRDCIATDGAVEKRQCTEADCGDMASEMWEKYCPGATCEAVSQHGYCDKPYGTFCKTHDHSAPLPPPPGFTATSRGSDLCPKLCRLAGPSDTHVPKQPDAPKHPDAPKQPEHHPNPKLRPSPEKARTTTTIAVPGKIDIQHTTTESVLTESQLIATLQAMYPSDDVAAAGNFQGVHDPHTLELSDALARFRAPRIKAAMKWNWDMYAKCAWGADELLPQTCEGQDNWGGMGFTLVDALDTLWLMDLKDEFKAGRDWVASSLDFSTRKAKASVFETNIRILGGLLGAFDLSNDQVFLDKAKDLATRFLPAFDTPTGLPYPAISVGTGKVGNTWTGDDSLLAELGTVQLEFRYLSYHTGDPTFRNKAERVYTALKGKDSDGIFPSRINRRTGRASGVYTFGGLADSFYEYLIKMWIQGGRKEPQWREAYDKAILGMRHKLTKDVPVGGRNVAYVGASRGRSVDNKMEHLTCFVPGMLALGAALSDDPKGSVAAADMQLAKRLAFTCHEMYATTKTGLGPEHAVLRGGGLSVGSATYILRPEAAESMFVLHSLTGHPVFRQWAWEMFEAIERNCKTTYGYGAYTDVNKVGLSPENKAESFFMAETLKYVYMIQLPMDHPSRPKLDDYVFNTEAHPLKVFGGDWSASSAKLH